MPGTISPLRVVVMFPKNARVVEKTATHRMGTEFFFRQLHIKSLSLWITIEINLAEL